MSTLAAVPWMSAARWLLLLLVAMPAALRAAEEAPAPAAKQVECPACAGTGDGTCAVQDCRAGKAPCPRICLKKSMAWEKRKVPDHPHEHQWVKVESLDRMTHKWFPYSSLGHLIEFPGGIPADAGVCPTCKGTGVGECATCMGTGRGGCTLCHKNGTVAEPAAKEWIAKRDEERAERAFTLKDGRVIYGKAVMRTPTAVTIKTDDGQKIEVPPDQIATEPQPKKKGKIEMKPIEPKK